MDADVTLMKVQASISYPTNYPLQKMATQLLIVV